MEIVGHNINAANFSESQDCVFKVQDCDDHEDLPPTSDDNDGSFAAADAHALIANGDALPVNSDEAHTITGVTGSDPLPAGGFIQVEPNPVGSKNMVGGTGQFMRLSNAALRFESSSVSPFATGACIRYALLGKKDVYLMVNDCSYKFTKEDVDREATAGDIRIIAQSVPFENTAGRPEEMVEQMVLYDGLTIGGVVVRVTRWSSVGGSMGKIYFSGDIQNIEVGGTELLLDDFVPTCPCEVNFSNLNEPPVEVPKQPCVHFEDLPSHFQYRPKTFRNQVAHHPEEEEEGPIRVRKEIHSMTYEERVRYIDAYLAAYNNPDNVLKDMIDSHLQFFSRGLHNNGAFLPWHRGYILDMENLLRSQSTPGASSVTVPYWNWSHPDYQRPIRDTLPPDNHDAGMATDTSMFGTGDHQFSEIVIPAGDRVVKTGRFGYPEFIMTNGRALQRRGSGSAGASEASVIDLVEVRYPNANQYDSFRNRLEHGPGLHDSIHCIVGGTMCSARSSNDPVFFLHHAAIDCIWARWQQTSQAHTEYYTGQTDIDAIMPVSMYTPRQVLDLTNQPGGVHVVYEGFEPLDDGSGEDTSPNILLSSFLDGTGFLQDRSAIVDRLNLYSDPAVASAVHDQLLNDVDVVINAAIESFRPSGVEGRPFIVYSQTDTDTEQKSRIIFLQDTDKVSDVRALAEAAFGSFGSFSGFDLRILNASLQEVVITEETDDLISSLDMRSDRFCFASQNPSAYVWNVPLASSDGSIDTKSMAAAAINNALQMDGAELPDYIGAGMAPRLKSSLLDELESTSSNVRDKTAIVSDIDSQIKAAVPGLHTTANLFMTVTSGGDSDAYNHSHAEIQAALTPEAKFVVALLLEAVVVEGVDVEVVVAAMFNAIMGASAEFNPESSSTAGTMNVSIERLALILKPAIEGEMFPGMMIGVGIIDTPEFEALVEDRIPISERLYLYQFFTDSAAHRRLVDDVQRVVDTGIDVLRPTDADPDTRPFIVYSRTDTEQKSRIIFLQDTDKVSDVRALAEAAFGGSFSEFELRILNVSLEEVVLTEESAFISSLDMRSDRFCFASQNPSAYVWNVPLASSDGSIDTRSMAIDAINEAHATQADSSMYAGTGMAPRIKAAIVNAIETAASNVREIADVGTKIGEMVSQNVWGLRTTSNEFSSDAYNHSVQEIRAAIIDEAMFMIDSLIDMSQLDGVDIEAAAEGIFNAIDGVDDFSVPAPVVTTVRLIEIMKPVLEILFQDEAYFHALLMMMIDEFESDGGVFEVFGDVSLDIPKGCRFISGEHAHENVEDATPDLRGVTVKPSPGTAIRNRVNGYGQYLKIDDAIMSFNVTQLRGGEYPAGTRSGSFRYRELPDGERAYAFLSVNGSVQTKHQSMVDFDDAVMGGVHVRVIPPTSTAPGSVQLMGISRLIQQIEMSGAVLLVDAFCFPDDTLHDTLATMLTQLTPLTLVGSILAATNTLAGITVETPLQLGEASTGTAETAGLQGASNTCDVTCS
jgi:tyrosinase